MEDIGIEVTIKVTDLERIVKDARVKEIVEQCSLKGADLGACVEVALLDRLVEIFSEEGQPGVNPEAPPKPMQDWVTVGPADGCRPCALPVALQWYKDELTTEGQSELAAQLEQVGTSEDPLTTAKEMDRIKDVVTPKTRGRLLEFDATTQANTP